MNCGLCDRISEAEKQSLPYRSTLTSSKRPLCSYHYAKQIIDNSNILVAETDTSHVVGAIESAEDYNGLMVGSLDMHVNDNSLLAQAIGGENGVVDIDRTIAAELTPSTHVDTGETIGFVEVPIHTENKAKVVYGLFPRYTEEDKISVKTIVI